MPIPTASDVTNLLGGITVPAGFDVQGQIDASLASLERITGYRPFIASDTDSTRYCDPPGSKFFSSASRAGGRNVLKLDDPLCTITSIVTADRTLNINSDFWIGPTSEAPWFTVRFAVAIYGTPKSLAITGRWGYCLDLPSDIFDAIVKMAASNVVLSIAEKIRSGVTEWAEDDVKEKYDVKGLEQSGSTWREQAEKVFAGYKRLYF